MGIDDAADHPEGESFGGRVNGENLSTFHIRVVPGQLDVLARLELAAVEKAHGARQQHHVALFDGAIEEWLTRPGRLDHPALVLQHRLKDSQPFARRNDSLGDHLADDGAVHPRLQ